MLAKVKKYLKEGQSFSIFTARADRENEVEGIKKWLKDNDLPDLEVTNIKSPKFTQFWDDRAIDIKKNTGMTKDEEEYYYTYPVSLQDYININSQRIS